MALVHGMHQHNLWMGFGKDDYGRHHGEDVCLGFADKSCRQDSRIGFVDVIHRQDVFIAFKGRTHGTD